jgi:hypothetical protein
MVFEIVARKFMPHFEEEKGENPHTSGNVMHIMHLECDLLKINVIVWGSTTVIITIPQKIINS